MSGAAAIDDLRGFQGGDESEGPARTMIVEQSLNLANLAGLRRLVAADIIQSVANGRRPLITLPAADVLDRSSRQAVESPRVHIKQRRPG